MFDVFDFFDVFSFEKSDPRFQSPVGMAGKGTNDRRCVALGQPSASKIWPGKAAPAQLNISKGGTVPGVLVLL